MAISNYSELVSAIYKFTIKDSNDPFLTAATVDNIIYLAEAEMSRRLRTRQNEAAPATITITAGDNTVTAPNDLMQVKAIYIANNTYLTPASPAEFIDKNLYTIVAPPQFYYLFEDTIVFGAVPDTAYTATLLYYKKVGNLSAGNPTNSVLTAYPDLYLYACLKQAYIALQDDINEAKTTARLEMLYNSVITQDKQANLASGTRGLARKI